MPYDLALYAVLPGTVAVDDDVRDAAGRNGRCPSDQADQVVQPVAECLELNGGIERGELADVTDFGGNDALRPDTTGDQDGNAAGADHDRLKVLLEERRVPQGLRDPQSDDVLGRELHADRHLGRHVGTRQIVVLDHRAR